jgi:YbbR domain-containing protein
MTVLLRNFRLKLLALAFAVAIWSVVAYTENPTQSHKYILTMTNPALPAGLVLVGDAHPQVTVTVIGTADNLRGGVFDPHGLVVVGNFGHVSVGRNHVPIRVDNPDTSVQVDAPSTISVQVDQLASATVAVTIQRLSALPAGVHEQTGGTSVTPASVRVDGPKSQLTGIQAVVQVALAGLPQPGFTTTYPVLVLDANKKVLTSMVATPPTVTVKMVIQADAITIAKPVGWTLTGQPAACFRVSNVQIAPLEVQATGLESALTLPLLATDPVDVTAAKADVIRTVTIRPPAGVDVNQKTAQIHVFISPITGTSPCP